jgi:hypothetical protein
MFERIRTTRRLNHGGRWVAWIALVVLTAEVVRGDDFAPPPDGDVFYLAVFSSQGTPKTPNRAHNWGVAVHARTYGGERSVIAADTISWLPQTLDIQVLRMRPVPGVNLTQEQSLARAEETGQRVTLWGVFQIAPDAYRQFQRQRMRLVAGALGYQCLDTIGEAGNRRNGVNCIHALADFAYLLPHIPVAVQPYGDESAAMIAQALTARGLVVDPQADVSWIIETMGWNAAEIVLRSPNVPLPVATEFLTSD